MESTKNVRINIHFMLDDAGGSNFQENHDGYGSPIGNNNLDLSNLPMLLSNNFYILAVQTTENIETHRFLMP